MDSCCFDAQQKNTRTVQGMPYRKTTRYRDQLKRMRAAKERKRPEGPAPEPLFAPPTLRRVVIVIVP
jgi:hypothetical protein